MPSSDVRSSETSAQNARGKNFQKFTRSNFRGFIFRGSYFRVLVVGRENRENLDLAKISRYTVVVCIAGFWEGSWDGIAGCVVHVDVCGECVCCGWMQCNCY